MSVCRLSTNRTDPWCVWRSACADCHAGSALKKTSCGTCGREHSGWYDRKLRRVRDLPTAGLRIFLEFEVRRVRCRHCDKVKRERLEFLADNPLYTKRFAFYVGRRCRSSPIQDIAKELKLDWHTVKELDKQYMRAQLAKAGTPAPMVIGIDEISVRKGHTYRIVVSDLIRERPIWFGGNDRSEASMPQFYQWLGPNKSGRIRLAVMDMWKPFRNAATAHAPQAAILFDKFHIIRHLGEALDQVRKSEYARLSGKNRRFIKGQKYTLLSRKENLTLQGRQALQTLLRANKRLHTAYLLKESFGQLWSYEHEGWARRFFEQWRASLKWQRLKPYEKFADMIDRHWDGIAAYRKQENNVSLGFVEGLNNKIRVIQRRAYGIRDEEYLRLKILTCMLPAL
ncbi:ISL3 family transposase [Bradyrhizobium sp. CCGUVB4N]|uniref:ISL3 family transposase n=1 Tax=Bradyrhizobium sp. CCGUVB4N TaxID=2949631 RepID=UPI0020B2347E|nr:ISL3 family transposase [Bradyrhizobium sp. CCGUVB4N]MCP3380655.1 ISL3 family transposase [Bradyrhizobium sp. CCGUVB4N]